MNRRGVVLLTVLWIIVIAGTAAATALAATRRGLDTGAFRVFSVRARWAGIACLAAARSAMDEELRESEGEGPWIFHNWIVHRFDNYRVSSDMVCNLSFSSAPGDPIDLNSAPDSLLLSLPGFDLETVRAIRQYTNRFEALATMDEFHVILNLQQRTVIEEHLSELRSMVAFEPPRLLVTASISGMGRSRRSIVETWAPAYKRAAVVDRVTL